MTRTLIAEAWTFVVAVALVSPSPLYAQSKKDLNDCDNMKDWNVRVAGCTRAIEGRKWPRFMHVFHLQRGEGYQGLEQYDRAIQDYTVALKYKPGSSKALSDRATAYSVLGNFDLALKDADAALRSDPGNALAYNAKGVALLRKGQFDPAIDAFSKGIALNPGMDALFTNRAAAWQSKDETDRALTDLDSALKLSPTNFLALSNRCHVWKVKHESGNALADCNQAIRLNPDHAVSFYNRANVLFELGELEKALADYGQAIRIDPSNAGAYAARGNVWRKKLNLDRAISDLNQAIKLNPKVVASYVTRGLIQEAQGDVHSARQSFRTALELPATVSTAGTGGMYLDSFGDDQKVAKARLLALGEAGLVPAGPLYAAKPDEAKTAAISERRIALAIGNGAYATAPSLPNPPNDARLIARNLRNAGFQVSEGADLNREEMERLVADFMRGAVTASVALLFYAGHGVQIDGQNYLLPTDANTDVQNLKSELMSLDTILAGLDDRLRANIVILDACRNNPMLAEVAVAEGNRSIVIRAGLASTSNLGKAGTSGAGTLLAFSTAPGRVALDGEGANSPFSLALARHINTPGLEVQQMLTRVRTDVVAATKSQQVPWSNSSLLGEVYLAGRP
ncbi:MAG: tetratricopeptide repeat protein [Bradyrhizobium sp.]|uniref:caspase family protein n=1 Tax=Bradyrhizobium sp. TaxID=376 RepID=UPI0025C0ABB9|nr:caspase family protein [Bradyrhizobium sp.]MBI5260245.1 tetratricopeptide repeat protein [Bradyrhizobium sp.]